MLKFSERARELLEEPLFGVLATLNSDGSIQQTTMWYQILPDDTILMNTTTRRVKYHNMRRNPHVSLCVQKGYQYVTISGCIEMINDADRGQQDIFRIARHYTGVEKALRYTQDVCSKQQRVTLLLKPEHAFEYFSQE